MFLAKQLKETFKYEVEVNALIREATNNINQRVLALELQNNQLIIQNQKLEYDLNTLRHTIYTDVQRLEKRITDFTDLWHPIMTENMNRIKAELETTIKQAEREDIQKISFELENKLTKIVEDYKADKCVNQIVRQPEYKNTAIKLSTLANKINEVGTPRGYSFPTFNLLTVIDEMGVTITDDENNIIISNFRLDHNSNDFWKFFFNNDGYYKVFNYLTENCYKLKIFIDNDSNDSINIPMYHPYTPQNNNLPYTSIQLQTAIKHYDKIKRIVQNGGTIDHHLINNWNLI